MKVSWDDEIPNIWKKGNSKPPTSHEFIQYDTYDNAEVLHPAANPHFFLGQVSNLGVQFDQVARFFPVLGVSIDGGITKWILPHGKFQSKVDDLEGSPILRNLHMMISRFCIDPLGYDKLLVVTILSK